jgi:hypothetical protein
MAELKMLGANSGASTETPGVGAVFSFSIRVVAGSKLGGQTDRNYLETGMNTFFDLLTDSPAVHH